MTADRWRFAVLFCLLLAPGCGASDQPDPYATVLPPYEHQRVEEGENTVYLFNVPKPPLVIRENRISTENANRILDSLDLPEVREPGLNVEDFWFQQAPAGVGRLYRTDYRWDDYPLGPLTFERESYGCEWEDERYDCLKQITIGPTGLDENKHAVKESR